MKLIKKINNNFALAEDSKGEQIIVEGKGVGFIKMPCELDDLSVITRTYYDMDETYIDILTNLPLEVVDVANAVCVFFLSKAKCDVNSNLPFILADHINFAISRYQKGILVDMPLYYELMGEYPLEYEAAMYAMRLIRKKLHVSLPKNEAAGIMLNLINAEANVSRAAKGQTFDDIAKRVTGIVNEHMGIQVSENSFNYARFVTHLNYMYKRLKDNQQILSTNEKMYEEMVKEYPDTSRCVEAIAEYIGTEEKTVLTHEEKLYLILHVNRLCSRELEQ